MDYQEVVSFLCNNKLISFDEILSAEFSLERKEESHDVYFVNRRNNDNENKIVMKLAINDSFEEKELIRKEFFLISKIIPKGYFQTKISPQLFRNDSVLVRGFIAEDFIGLDKFLILKKETRITIFEYGINAIRTLRDWEINKSQKSDARSSFGRKSIFEKPWWLEFVPPLKRVPDNATPLKEFWLILANYIKNLSDILDKANDYWFDKTDKSLVHGDTKPKNILFNKKSEYRFIDWELWRIGVWTWDVAYFLRSIEKIDENFSEPFLSENGIFEIIFRAYNIADIAHNTYKKKILTFKYIIILQDLHNDLSRCSDGKNLQLLLEKVKSGLFNLIRLYDETV